MLPFGHPDHQEAIREIPSQKANDPSTHNKPNKTAVELSIGTSDADTLRPKIAFSMATTNSPPKTSSKMIPQAVSMLELHLSSKELVPNHRAEKDGERQTEHGDSAEQFT